MINHSLDFLSEPRLSTVGLIDPNTQEGIDFEDELIAELEDTIEDLKQDNICDEDSIAEELRIVLRRYVFHALKLKPKTSVHVLKV